VALAGVKTAVAVKKEVIVDIRTIGQVANNPDLVIAQKEYLIALKLGGERGLQNSVLSKLHLLGMSDSWIRDVVKRGTPDKELYQPTDASRVFIEASVYENDLASVIVGQKATVTFTHQGNAEYAGTIVGLNPTLSPTTRAATAFIEIPRNIQPLRAGMVVSVRFESHLGERLVIPNSAVIDTGKRRVAVVVKDNYYDPRDVEIGEHADGLVVVKSGVLEGETVVAAANFLVDSEAQLKERLSTITDHQH
jgi:Cu(I)/Ag(I) efflux system membrane fusion protein